MKRPALLLLLLALAAVPARADTIWPPPAHVDEARFTEPAVTIDGEIAATLGDVNRLVFDPNAFIPGGRSWARAAQKLADDFLLAREAKARGATRWSGSWRTWAQSPGGTSGWENTRSRRRSGRR